jgi:hypothetical protein
LAAERLSMRKIREILRQKWVCLLFSAPRRKVLEVNGVESKGASDTQGILLGLPSSRKEAQGRCAWRRLSEDRWD